MSFVVTPHGLEDYACWQATDRATLKHINRLLDAVARAGALSRRIDEGHRLRYVVEVDEVVILQARYHYG